MAIYCGYPKALNALRTMRRVYDELDKERAAKADAGARSPRQ